ncbi:hypothetical protein [Actinomadura spongiicola]|uniref:hypothetical protein n=1 Tax=Actinomadura spongiicola TaxID=2303421 RepID=UPI0018F11FF9|nr:hypothetical protein [Actinomadura spongiicola]
MLSDICLTAIQGMDPVDFVVRLGADRRMAERPVLFKDFDQRSVELADSVAMFCRSGNWSYISEVEQSTWRLIFLDPQGRETLERQGDEVVRLDRFQHEHPWVCYIDAASELISADPRESLLETPIPLEDRLGALAVLDAAMRQASTVRETFPGCEGSEDEDKGVGQAAVQRGGRASRAVAAVSGDRTGTAARGASALPL